MDKKIAGILGAVASLGSFTAAEASPPPAPADVLRATSYADLLEPIPNAVAQVLGVHEEPGKALTQTLCEHVKPHKLLFVLDNCEHLVNACASLAEALLRGASDLRILATSREALHIRGEQIYHVLPLKAPDRKAGVETLLRSEAVQLFIERARLQKPGFLLTEGDAPAIADLCARLDGIPLALELAAARMRSFLDGQGVAVPLSERDRARVAP